MTRMPQTGPWPCASLLYYSWAKGTELLALYMLQGEPAGIRTLLDKHFEAGVGAAATSGDAQTEVLLRWLHATSHQMVAGSLWWVRGL